MFVIIEKKYMSQTYDFGIGRQIAISKTARLFFTNKYDISIDLLFFFFFVNRRN